MFEVIIGLHLMNSHKSSINPIALLKGFMYKAKKYEIQYR